VKAGQAVPQLRAETAMKSGKTLALRATGCPLRTSPRSGRHIRSGTGHSPGSKTKRTHSMVKIRYVVIAPFAAAGFLDSEGVGGTYHPLRGGLPKECCSHPTDRAAEPSAKPIRGWRNARRTFLDGLAASIGRRRTLIPLLFASNQRRSG
jgi:hypothetical protein